MDAEANVKWGSRIMQNYDGKLEIVAIVTGVKGASILGSIGMRDSEDEELASYAEEL